MQRYVPKFDNKWSRFARPVGTSLRVGETYIKVRGEWEYLYRALDKHSNSVDLLLTQHRDIAAAKHFLTRAIEKPTAPEKVSVDGYASTHTAIRELKESKILMINVLVRTSKCLNNLIKQDQLRVKQRVYPMLSYYSCRWVACASRRL